MSATTPVFGRRGSPQAPSRPPGRAFPPLVAPVAHDAVGTADNISAELAARLKADAWSSSREEIGGRLAGRVPWSWSAALIAGLITSCLLAGFTLVDMREAATSEQAKLMEQMGFGSSAGPWVIVSSLVGGARATASAVFLAQLLLRPFRVTHALAFAVTGAMVSGALAYAGLALGSHSLLPAVLSGFSAGFFYRTFAGIKTS
jgi:hypothetical protein